jgi:PhnB protein
VAFYERAFGAEEIYRNTYPDGRIVAELAVGEARFRVTDEAPEAGNLSPAALGGTSVRLNLLVADPDGVAAAAIANGAIEVAPGADQSYGLRQGRLADPFGHQRPVRAQVADARGRIDGHVAAAGSCRGSLRGAKRPARSLRRGS